MHLLSTKLGETDTITHNTDNIPPAPPANTERSPNVVAMLGQRRIRWTSITTTLGLCLIFVV